MQLEALIRSNLSEKWKPLVKKNKCDECDSTEKLEEHHNKQFIDMVDEALELLNLPYKDTNDYTKQELKLIRLLIQGMHLDIKSETLCMRCHDKRHEKIKYSKIKVKKEVKNDGIQIKTNNKIQCIIDCLKELKNNPNGDLYTHFASSNIINNKRINKKQLRNYLKFSKTTFNNLTRRDMFKDFCIEMNINYKQFFDNVKYIKL